MRQDFSGMTPEMLAELFPVVLREYDPAWAAAYEQEAEELKNLFGPEQVVRMGHIGSTSVPGLTAKPTVDVLAEVAENTDISALSERMLEAGYVINTPPQDLIMYLKGYTPQGFEGQAFHIHVRHLGDWGELYFRDYLRAHPEAARAYEALKMELQTQYPNDRDNYTDAKGEFVRHCTELARREFSGRYDPGK